MNDHPKIPDAHFRLLFDKSPEPYLILLPDEPFTIIDVNEAYLRVTNTQRAQLVGQPMFEAFPDNPADPAATGTANLRASLERAVATKAADTMAFQRYDIPSPQGDFEERYWSPINTPVLSPEGEVLYLIHRVEDVTEFVRLTESRQQARDRAFTLQAQNDKMAAELLRRSQELNTANTELRQRNVALRQSQSRLSRVLEIETVGVLFFDMDANFLDANDSFLRMIGYDRTALESGELNSGRVTAPEWLPRTRQVFEELRATGRFGPYEKELVRPDGSRWWGLFAGTQLSENENVEFVLDVTERKRADEALRENDRRKDEFLAMLAHELRNPLAAIHNAVRLLERPDPERDLRRYVDILNRQADVLRRLVDDLLDVSRITRGLVELRQERVDLVRVADRALESVRPLTDEKRHEVNVVLPSETVHVVGDAVRLEQVLVNLLTNAAKYTDPGGHIAFHLQRRGDWAELRVRDTGIGMAPEVLDRVFDLFGQAERGLARSEGGLGIGLTIVRRLVELHGGHVEARSAGLERGAEFSVSIPLAPAQQTVPAPVAQRASVSLRSKRILLVEDSKDIAETLALLLEDSGHEVLLASDGPSALEKVEETDPDLILLDIGLPGLDGYEVARQLRQNPRTQQAVLVALTGYGRADDVERARAAGFDRHFTKPVDIEALEAFVNAVESRTRPL